MTPTDLETLRHASAHVIVDQVDAPALGHDAAHHLFRVLRLREGEVVTVTDGAGRWRRCRVADGGVIPDGDVCTTGRADGGHEVTIACAIPKRDRPEWIVQKLTELGVARIVLLHTDRSVVRWQSDRADRHLAKLRKVTIEALQQSRGLVLPDIVGPVDATTVLPEAVIAEPGGRPLTGHDRTIAIGPEGGWSDGELASAADRVTLGDRVLRVETAALAAAARVIGHPA